MPYLDGTEQATPAIAPKFCPECRGPIVTKWSAILQHRLSIGYFAVAIPSHVCEKCGHAVRVMALPEYPLYRTRKAARASRAKEAAIKNEEREARRRGRLGL